MTYQAKSDSTIQATDEMYTPMNSFIKETEVAPILKTIEEISPFVLKEVQLETGEIAKDGTKIVYHPDGETIHIWVHGIDGVKHGFEKIYWPNGNLKHKIEWNMGVKEGREITYYESGPIRSSIEWIDNNETATIYSYYENGNLRSAVPFREGIMHGTQKHYYCIGKLYAEINYSHGKRHGLERSWYPHGPKKTQCSYFYEDVDGDEFQWNQDGLLLEHSKWNKGKLLQAVYYEKGKPIGAEIHKGTKVQILKNLTPAKEKKKTMTQKELIAAALAAKAAATTHKK